MKGWREYLKGIIIKFIKITCSFIKWVFYYSGLEFIYRKFNPPKNSQSSPTGFIWIVGIYVAFFGVASQRYENRIDIIENRANSIFAQLAVPSVQKKALSRISRVQNMQCPYKPNILNPSSVFISLFRDSKYKEMIEQLKETVEDWKGSFDSVNLGGAILGGADLQGANLGGAYLQGADLWGANLRKADLRVANLRKADLRKANLREANLGGANLLAADLRGANLVGAGLQGVDLGGAILVAADLWEADLWGANLQKADLRGAYLRGADLREADLQGTYLQVANLWGADLRGAEELTAQQLCKASTLYMIKLDQELESQIKQECPGLLKIQMKKSDKQKEAERN